MSPEEGSGGKRPEPYRRPELPFERKSEVPSAALKWSAAGFEFAVAVVLFFLGGRWLDAKVGSGPWLTLVGSLVGIAVGTYLLLRPALSADARRPEGHAGGSGAKGEDEE